MLPTIGVIVGAIGIMISFYIVTRMFSLGLNPAERLFSKILAGITVFVAALVGLFVGWMSYELIRSGMETTTSF